FLAQAAPADPGFDLGPGLKGRLLVKLRVAKAPAGEDAGQNPGLNGPVPAGPKGGDLLSEGDRAYPHLLSAPPSHAAVDVALKVRGGKCLGGKPFAQALQEVVQVHPDRGKRVLHHRPVRVGLEVLLDQVLERKGLWGRGEPWVLGQGAVGKQEGGDV